MRRKNKPKIYQDLTILDYSDEVRGIAKDNNKVIFVRGALVDEIVDVKRYKNNAKFAEAEVIEIKKINKLRITPECEFFNICGGCSLQYLSQNSQIDIKFNIVKKMFATANIKVEKWLDPIKDKAFGYRRKARLGVRFVHKKDKVLVGFREKNSAFLADMNKCLVLHPQIGQNLVKLAEMVSSLSIKEKIAQFEVAISQEDSAIIIRNLAEFSAKDIEILTKYGNDLGFIFYTQSGGIDTIKALNQDAKLTYTHPDFNINFSFLASDFTQVNFEINQKMVVLALELLELKDTDIVIDLFCGLGNFTLPIANKVAKIVGIEGNKDLVLRAKINAEQNNIENAEFYQADLFEEITNFKWAKTKYNKALIDPARSGAAEIMSLLPKLGIKRLVYVSCNPHTLVRDSLILKKLGYKALKGTIMDMFTHTEHIETMVLFVKDN